MQYSRKRTVDLPIKNYAEKSHLALGWFSLILGQENPGNRSNGREQGLNVLVGGHLGQIAHPTIKQGIRSIITYNDLRSKNNNFGDFY